MERRFYQSFFSLLKLNLVQWLLKEISFQFSFPPFLINFFTKLIFELSEFVWFSLNEYHDDQSVLLFNDDEEKIKKKTKKINNQQINKEQQNQDEEEKFLVEEPFTMG